MKNIILVIALAAFVFTANFAKATDSLFGNTLTKFGTYQLTPSSKTVEVDHVSYKVWELSYSGSSEKYQLIEVPGKDGKSSYQVLGKGFGVVYQVGSDNFGGSYIEPKLMPNSTNLPGKKITEKELQSQTVNTPTMNSEEYLNLIACFMPRLLK